MRGPDGIPTTAPGAAAGWHKCANGEVSMDHSAEAKRHRHMAEELRTKAGLMTDTEVCATYTRLAESYELLADSEERRALNLKKTK